MDFEDLVLLTLATASLHFDRKGSIGVNDFTRCANQWVPVGTDVTPVTDEVKIKVIAYMGTRT